MGEHALLPQKLIKALFLVSTELITVAKLLQSGRDDFAFDGMLVRAAYAH